MSAKNVQNTRGVNNVKMNVPRIILQTPINFVYRASASVEGVLDQALINVINVEIIRSILYVYFILRYFILDLQNKIYSIISVIFSRLIQIN